MAEGFARKYGMDAASAGTMPATEISESAVLAMREKGIDISGARPKSIDFQHLADFERIVAMGPGVPETSPDLNFHENWDIDDPVNLDFAVYRRVRDSIEERVKSMAMEIKEWTQPRRRRA
jgi:arsenate reductase